MSRYTQVKQGLTQITRGASRVLGLTKIYSLLRPYLQDTINNTRTGFTQITTGFKHIFGATPAQQLDKFLNLLLSDWLDSTKEQRDRKAVAKTLIENVCKMEKYGHKLGTELELDSTAKFYARTAKVVLDNLGCRHLVGMQGMSGPVGLAYFLRYKQGKPLPAEQGGGTQMSLEIISATTEVGTSDLGTLSMAAVDDANLTIEDGAAYVASALGLSTATTIDGIVLQQISNVATVHEQQAEHGVNAALAVSNAANTITCDTRRGAGNWIVLQDEKALRRLVTDAGEWLQVAPDEKQLGGLTYIGVLNGTIPVYLSNVERALSHDVTVGYIGSKGGENVDCGIAYAPYVLIQSRNVIVDPMTFEPVTKLGTRYGIACDAQSKDYYRKFNFK